MSQPNDQILVFSPKLSVNILKVCEGYALNLLKTFAEIHK